MAGTLYNSWRAGSKASQSAKLTNENDRRRRQQPTTHGVQGAKLEKVRRNERTRTIAEAGNNRLSSTSSLTTRHFPAATLFVPSLDWTLIGGRAC